MIQSKIISEPRGVDARVLKNMSLFLEFKTGSLTDVTFFKNLKQYSWQDTERLKETYKLFYLTFKTAKGSNWFMISYIY